MKFIHTTLLSIAAAGLAGCVTTGEPEKVAAEVKLAPMPKPVVAVGDTWHALKDGKEFKREIVAVNGDMMSARESDGCEFTAMAWGFAPGATWSNCKPFTDGTQKITAAKGEIWPLAVGKTFSYDVTGSNSAGNTWSGTRKCSVPETARITTVSGQYDAFKVVCEDPWTRRTWYVAPAAETTVHFTRYRKRQNETTVLEFIKREKGSPTS